MQLIVIRHGIAENDSPDGSDDSRRLSSEGIEKTTHAAEGLAKIAAKPQVILTSPKTRARQTAEILGRPWRVEPALFPPLSQDAPRDIAKKIRQRPEESIWIVGHEPTQSQLLQLLCAPGAGGEFTSLKNCSAACLELEWGEKATPLSCRLLWLATPKMLRGLAGKD
ncbi:MAG: histidine phosphatase family protein [Phycisphaeraceae bacterium]|nr:histidine phosphatase family protein [Phycisphaeraceae bacterium]